MAATQSFTAWAVISRDRLCFSGNVVDTFDKLSDAENEANVIRRYCSDPTAKAVSVRVTVEVVDE